MHFIYYKYKFNKYSLSIILITMLLSTLACSQPDPFDSPGYQVYKDSGCIRCHGIDLKGGDRGPTLLYLSDYWEQEELVEFLKNPSRYKEDVPRLDQLSQQYREAMPSVVISEEDRKKLSEFLLNPK